MTREESLSTVDLERELVRYLVEQRMSRRELLERIAALGAAAALAPIVAACGAAATAAPSPSPSAAGPSPTAAPSGTPTPQPTPAPTPESELFVYNWDGYIGDSTVPDFEKKYNV